MFWRVAWRSLLERRISVLLTVGALTLSILVLVGIEHLRQSARSGFARTVSGVDLIVGARTGDINLLLYSVFRLGNASNNIQWRSYQEIASSPDVAWSIPLSLGDSHKGYKVLGTNRDYFVHYRFGKDQPLVFAAGGPFVEVLDVVLGAEVARKLGYRLGDELELSHGTGSTSFTHHDEHHFVVAGILAPTGTPVDQTLHIDLAGMEAVHQEGYEAEVDHLEPHSITAFMLGLKSRVKVFQVQRQVNQYSAEPLQAILPGVTLTQLWSTLSLMENTLQVISALVLVAALFGMAAMLLVSLRERRREIVLLRALGASPVFIALLLQMEVLLMVTGSALLALGLLFLALGVGQSFWVSSFGLHISLNLFSETTGLSLLVIFGGAVLMGLIPAWSAYRISAGLARRMD
jgi:putative ABC transport system permease protein